MDDTVHEFDTQHAVGTEPAETVGVTLLLEQRRNGN